jgi:hypothetical protein
MMEAQLVLAMVVQRQQLELVPGFKVEMEPVVTLRPRYGMAMNLRPRGASAPRANERRTASASAAE